jgi:hypothetical protein
MFVLGAVVGAASAVVGVWLYVVRLLKKEIH